MGLRRESNRKISGFTRISAHSICARRDAERKRKSDNDIIHVFQTAQATDERNETNGANRTALAVVNANVLDG